MRAISLRARRGRKHLFIGVNLFADIPQIESSEMSFRTYFGAGLLQKMESEQGAFWSDRVFCSILGL